MLQNVTLSESAADPRGRAVCGRSLAEVAGSNLAGVMGVCLL